MVNRGAKVNLNRDYALGVFRGNDVPVRRNEFEWSSSSWSVVFYGSLMMVMMMMGNERATTKSR